MGKVSMKIEDMQIGEQYKFVKVGNEYRFTHIFDSHKSLVVGNEVATAAGTLSLVDNGWLFWETMSLSLGVYSQGDTAQELCNVLQKNELQRWERDVITMPTKAV